MKASEFDTSNYLNAKTAGKYNGKTLTIFDARAEDIREIRKLIIGFEGVEKSLIANKTNREVLTEKFGDDIDDWIGKTVILHIVLVMFEGKRTPSINLEPVTDGIAPVIDGDSPIVPTPKRKRS